MRAGGLFALLALVACSTSVRVDPAGLRCDEQSPCRAGYLCVANACVAEGGDLCGAVSCGEKAPTCLDADTRRAFSGAGTCQPADGTCSYPTDDTTCASGCQGGACVGDPCAGVVCQSAPEATCVDEMTLRTFAGEGACEAGSCAYTATDRRCTKGCEGGICVDEDLCVGVTCDDAPAPVCTGGKVRTYREPGECTRGTGQCSYPFTESPCPGGCVNGVCVSPGATFTKTFPRLSHPVLAIDQAPGSAGGHALAVGPAGKVSKWSANAWSELASPLAAVSLRAVWFAGEGSAYLVGDEGALLHYDGAELSAIKLPEVAATTRLVAVHGVDDRHVLIAASDGRYWRCAGAQSCAEGGFSLGRLDPLGGPYTLTSAWVSPAGVEWLAGQCGALPLGCVARGVDGKFSISADPMTGLPFTAIGPSLDDAGHALAGRTGEVMLRKVTDLGVFGAQPASMVGEAVAGISVAHQPSLNDGVYVLTRRGGDAASRLYRLTRVGPTRLLDLYLGTQAGGGQALARGDGGPVLVADSNGVASSVFRSSVAGNEVLDLGESWVSTAFSARGGLMLLNSRGDLGYRSSVDGRWRLFRNTSEDFEDLLGLAVGSSSALLVGRLGRAYSVNSEGEYTRLNSGTSSTLNAACRASETELYVASERGAVLPYNGLTFGAAVTLGTSALKAVHCAGPGKAVAVGAQGAVYRLSGGTWSALPGLDTAVTLTTAWQTPGGIVYVAGDGLFARYQGTAWTKLPSRPGVTQLAVLGEDDVYASVSSGVARFSGGAWREVVPSTQPVRAAAATAGKLVFAGSNGLLLEGQAP